MIRLLLTLSVCLLLACGGPEPHPEALPHFASFVETSDGWRLSLFRVPPTGGQGSPAFGTPVLLVHGTAMNHTAMMFEGSDLSQALSEVGFDVWVADLRGTRTSRAPAGEAGAAASYTVDDLAQRDVPAILAAVRAATGRDQLFWVGHSLGGILGYLTLQGPLRDQIAGIVTLGTPGALSHPTDAALGRGGLGALLPKRGAANLRGLIGPMKAVLRVSPDAPLVHLLFNSENLDTDAAVAFAGPGLENVSGGLLAQYRDWLERGALTSADGATDYTAAMAQISAPALVVAGRVDQLIPPWMAREGFDRLASIDKTWMVMGRAGGQRHDYGHVDLMLGDWAYEEVFPPVRDWLIERAALGASAEGD